MYGETESDMIRRKAQGEREILAIRQEGLVASITEQTTFEETLKIMQKYWELENKIGESKRLERAETDRANLKGDADRQIQIFNSGLGQQKLLIDEASAKVKAYEQLWNYAHTTMTGYTAQLLDVGMKVFQGLEDNLTQFVMTGKMKFKDFADSVIADLVRIAIRASITAPLAGALTGLFSSSASSAGVNLSGGNYSLGGNYSFGGGKASGGPVYGGTPYLVGERGPELFVPQTPGQIVPNTGSSGNVRVEIINSSGQPMAVKSSNAQVNPQETVISIVIDGIQRDVMGLRTMLRGT